MMTEGWSSPIAGHLPSSLDTMEWHTIPETNKPALPNIWKTSAGMNAAKMQPNGAQMGHDAISTGFCDTRINAGGSCIMGEAYWCNMECLLLPGA